MSLSLFGMLIPCLHSQNADRVNRILNKLEKKYKTTECVSHRFTQKKTISQLKGEFQFEGILYFKKPHFLRIEMKGDAHLKIYCNGQNIWIQDLDLDEVTKYDFQEKRTDTQLKGIIPPLFINSIEELKSKFEVRLLETGGNNDRLELSAKSDLSAVRILQLEIGPLGNIVWMKAEYQNGDSTEMEFRAWKTHPEISDYFFQYMAPIKEKESERWI